MTQIVHIGYPKTGSTFLQKQVFKHIKGYKILIKEPVLKSITNPTLTEKEIQTKFENISSINNLIISDEDLVTNKPEHVSPEKKAERIKLLFPHAKIILVIRNQMDILPSAYDQYLKGGGVLTFDNYLKEYIHSGKIFHWQYHHIIQIYTSLFGRENVKICLFEEIISNKIYINNLLEEFKLTLTKSIDFKRIRNRGLTLIIRKLWRCLNHFTRHQIYSSFPHKTYHFHIPGLFTVMQIFFPVLNKILYTTILKINHSYIPENLKDELINTYKDSNWLLANKLNIQQIIKYNYPI